MGLAEQIKVGDWRSVRSAIAKLNTKLGPISEPTFAGLTLTGLTASRLIATNADKVQISSDLLNWIAGTANRINVSGDGAGGVTLSGPQDYHIGAEPTFAELYLNKIFALTNNAEEMLKITRATSGTAADGIGLSLGFYLENDDGDKNLAARIQVYSPDIDDGYGERRNAIKFIVDARDGDLNRDIAVMDSHKGFGFTKANSGSSYFLYLDSDALTVNRTLHFHINDSDRTVDLAANLYIESTSRINQDLTTDADVSFAQVTLDNLMVVTSTSITNTLGAISFGDDNLSTTGTLGCGNLTVGGTCIVNSGAANTALKLISTDNSIAIVMADDATTPDDPIAIARVGNNLKFYTGDDVVEPISTSILRLTISSTGNFDFHGGAINAGVITGTSIIVGDAKAPFILTAAISVGGTTLLYDANAPIAFRVIDAWSINTAATSGQWNLTDGTNNITAALTTPADDRKRAPDLAGVSNHLFIDDNYHDIAVNGTLAIVNNAKLVAACMIYVMCLPI